jgi:hypothetical protein
VKKIEAIRVQAEKKRIEDEILAEKRRILEEEKAAYKAEQLARYELTIMYTDMNMHI